MKQQKVHFDKNEDRTWTATFFSFDPKRGTWNRAENQPTNFKNFAEAQQWFNKHEARMNRTGWKVMPEFSN